jgi:threonine/homoserine/homoserine lactone efflux protein
MAIFFSSLLLGYTGAMMPGPLLTYDIERSLQGGWKKGLLVPLGHILFEMVLVLLIVLGMGAFLKLPWPQVVILFVGGGMLLFFGGDMIRCAVKGTLQLTVKDGAVPKRGENLGIIIKSGMISVMNPYFLIWWASIGLGSFLLANTTLGIWGVILFYAGHALADLSWYFVISLFCDRISKWINGKIYRVIIMALGVALVGFSIWFIATGIMKLLSIL